MGEREKVAGTDGCIVTMHVSVWCGQDAEQTRTATAD